MCYGGGGGGDGGGDDDDDCYNLCAVAATFASTEQKEARTLLALIQVASQLPATCVMGDV